MRTVSLLLPRGFGASLVREELAKGVNSIFLSSTIHFGTTACTRPQIERVNRLKRILPLQNKPRLLALPLQERFALADVVYEIRQRLQALSKRLAKIVPMDGYDDPRSLGFRG
jgi:hypothetical protein